jgi:hypothetical protein
MDYIFFKFESVNGNVFIDCCKTENFNQDKIKDDFKLFDKFKFSVVERKTLNSIPHVNMHLEYVKMCYRKCINRKKKELTVIFNLI